MNKCINILIKFSLNLNPAFVKDLALKTVLYMTENWKESYQYFQFSLNLPIQAGPCGAPLTDLSKAFDCIMHDLLITKPQAYGFDNDSLNFICNYVVGPEQRIKINSFFTTCSKIENGLPQGILTATFTFQ